MAAPTGPATTAPATAPVAARCSRVVPQAHSVRAAAIMEAVRIVRVMAVFLERWIVKFQT
jgi:hypothetical protein